MANKAKLTLYLAQNARTSRDTQTFGLLVKPSGSAFLRADAETLMHAMAAVLGSVMFSTTHFLRAVYAEVTEDLVTIPHTAFSIPFATTGIIAMPGGSAICRPQLCAVVNKGAANGKGSRDLLRYSVSTDEDATYVEVGTIPARFLAGASADNGATTGELGATLLAAIHNANYKAYMPSYFLSGTYHEREVLSMAFGGFRNISNTKRKLNADLEIARGWTRKFHAWARQAWRLFNDHGGLSAVPAILAAIAALIAEITTAYTALSLAIQVLVKLPLLPVLV